jgi:polyphosphate kinase
VLGVAVVQESGHRGEEATRMKEVYDSRVAGLKRQIEEEQVSRRELEECFEQQLEEECRKAVDKEGAKQQGALERMKARRVPDRHILAFCPLPNILDARNIMP